MLLFNRNLQPASYANFRHVVESRGARKVRNRGKVTYLYDQRNRMIAMLKSASVDALGRTRPVQYYISA